MRNLLRGIIGRRRGSKEIMSVGLNLRIPSILSIGLILLMSLTGCQQRVVSHGSEHSFGAIADCQYCSSKGRGARKFSLSEKKLQQCVDHMNKLDLDFVVHLGDFIDRDYESFDVVGPIYNSLKMPKYHVLGNHDFSVKDELKIAVPEKLGLTSRYYDFYVKGWRYIILDGNDISFHAHPKDSQEFKEAGEYYVKNKVKTGKYNGALGAIQLDWVEGLLKRASKKHEKVILFCHFPVYPPNGHNLWNAEELVNLLERYSCVKAYINGHNHRGKYALKNGIHYLTLKGMVDTNETSYGLVRVSDERILLEGHGRETDREMLITD